ncbi:MAG: TerC family protein [Verrucomicrobia bacterium]|nr:TerC family protein [Verrucomicrobiota bacterium]
MPESSWPWIVFNLFVLAMLALDLGVFHRKAHVVSLRESLIWTAVWIGLALVFNLGVWHWLGPQKGLEFLTGYLIEKSLSVDNVFVFALIFTAFAVPAEYQHRVLFWGVLGALIMRAIMIAAGAALISNFTWIIYVFGAFLILTGLKMCLNRTGHKPVDPEHHPLVRFVRRLMPVTSTYHGSRFFVLENGRRAATPLFLVLLLVEASDLVFAVDSIPAIFAITKDPFIVYTSNVFAILGLRSLYFALAGLLPRFVYLSTGLGVVLAFVGVKMMLAHTPWKIDTLVSLGVVALILTVSVLASLRATRAPRPEPAPDAPTA